MTGWASSAGRSPTAARRRSTTPLSRRCGMRGLALPAPAGPAGAARGDGAARCAARVSSAPTSRSPTRRPRSRSPTRPADAAREIGAANTLTFGPDGSDRRREHRRARPARGARRARRGDARAGARRGGQRPRGGVGAARRRRRRGMRCGTAQAQRAEALAGQLGARAVEAPKRADLLVNCTSVGLAVERSATEDRGLNQLGSDGRSDRRVLICRRSGLPLRIHPAACRRRGGMGVSTTDGLEILVAQGALSFESVDGT